MIRTRPRVLPAAVALAASALSLASAVGSPAPSDVVERYPATQGRPLTPAGALVVDATTRQPAVGALPVDFVRSPDRTGPGGRGRYLLAINSGYGVELNAESKPAQSVAVVDLNATPAPVVVQNVYFPAPQSANVGLAFDGRPDTGGSYRLYVSGGFENRVWIFRLTPGARQPISPGAPGAGTAAEAPSIDLSGFATAAPVSTVNSGRAPVYPAGIALAPGGDTLFVANNLGESLGVVDGLAGERRLTRVDLRREGGGFVYPYGVVALPSTDGRAAAKVYVSCWGDGTIAVVDPAKPAAPVARIPVGRHPTAMLLNAARTRLYVVSSDADSVSVVDTRSDREVERVDVRVSERPLAGASPEGLALSEDGLTLYVANARGNSVAVVALSAGARGMEPTAERSRVRGFVPTGAYPSAVAVVGRHVFVGNGKGTGVANSSVVVNNSGHVPNAPNDRFPSGAGRGGQYSGSIVVGNLTRFEEPDERQLAAYTQQVMRNNGLVGERKTRLFRGASPIRHVIYVIKENRTYDQVFGDLARAGDGKPADGDASLAIFGAGEAARRLDGAPQNVTPNHRALALRFGLFDRFFVNSEASPDGHNWSTAAFSSDYVDKAFRWEYSGRGRSYDYEGFNRLPNYEALIATPASADDVAGFLRRYIPYLNNGRDVAEPESLYLWDAAARAGLSYRVYGEFVGTVSEADVAAINARRSKTYPDLTPNASVIPTKRALEGRAGLTYRNFDMFTPDAVTVDSYATAKAGGTDPLVSAANADPRLRGVSRIGEWLGEFREIAAERERGGTDRLPSLSIVRLSNDHTAGLQAGLPSPQFYVADNDYALGRLVEAVSTSVYWKDTAIVAVEDDAQDGPDHVDAHRSVALVISAYNRPGVLVHEYHTTVSIIRTIELLLGLEPMNLLDAYAIPADVFRDEADLTPYRATLPDIAADNMLTPPARDDASRYWERRTLEQDLDHADMADARTMNEIIWFSVRGAAPIPAVARLPVFDAMREGVAVEEDDEDEDEEAREMGDDDEDEDEGPLDAERSRLALRRRDQ